MKNRKTTIKMCQYYLVNFQHFHDLSLGGKDALIGLKNIVSATIKQIVTTIQQMHQESVNPIIWYFQKLS